MIETTDVRADRFVRGRVEAAWAADDPRASLALAPAEAVYSAAVWLRNRAFDLGLLRARRAGVPVVSVGNLVVGGAGKTPFTRWVVAQLRARGETPGVLHGGYADDEPELHRRWNPDLPVVAQRDRVHGAALAVEQGATVLVLDDAFQHRRIERDLDIVLVPAERWSDRPLLLPRGPWREPPTSLRRADLVIVTRRTASAGTAAEVAATVSRTLAAAGQNGPAVAGAATRRGRSRIERKAGSGAPIARVHLRADAWRPVGKNMASRSRSPDEVVVAVAALATPAAFLENARAAGAHIADRILFEDHHAYDAADVARIRSIAAGRPIVTTEKDWVKLDPVAADLSGWVLEQAVEFDAGEDSLSGALDALLHSRSTRRGGS